MTSSFAMSVIDIAKRTIKCYAQSSSRLATLSPLMHKHETARKLHPLRRTMYGAEYPTSRSIGPVSMSLSLSTQARRPVPRGRPVGLTSDHLGDLSRAAPLHQSSPYTRHYHNVGIAIASIRIARGTFATRRFDDSSTRCR